MTIDFLQLSRNLVRLQTNKNIVMILELLEGHFTTKYLQIGLQIPPKARGSRSGGLRRKLILEKTPKQSAFGKL